MIKNEMIKQNIKDSEKKSKEKENGRNDLK